MTKRHKKNTAARALACLLAVAVFYMQNLPNSLAASAGKLPELIPVGHTVGVRLQVDGVMVVGLSPVETEAGTVCPAERSGLLAGDLITQINSHNIDTVQALQGALREADGDTISMKISRSGENKTIALDPVKAEDGRYKIGAFIRDSVAGIGTLTFYDPKTGLFGALGHGIGDKGNKLFPFEGGSICGSVVKDVERGVVGKPGELKGEFTSTDKVGRLLANTEFGIFGLMEDRSVVSKLTPMPMARMKEVKPGPATILSNIQGDQVEEFEIEIVKVFGTDNANNRHFMLRVTDPELLALTGGVVQGMSGSPIVQNGKIVGAVTHVLVGDPKRGYGIFLENMFGVGSRLLQQPDGKSVQDAA